MNYPQHNGSETIRPDKVKCETIKELARRHLWDPGHITTDEELKNAILEIPPASPDRHSGVSISDRNN